MKLHVANELLINRVKEAKLVYLYLTNINVIY